MPAKEFDAFTRLDASDVNAYLANKSISNAIINGAFEINQRNFTSTTSSDVYHFDRWKNVGIDGTTTTSAQTFTPGAAPVAGYEAANYCRIVTTGQTLASAASRINQNIEDVRTFAGQTVTLSFFAKAASGTPKIALEFDQQFGAGGSTRVTTYAGQVTLSTSWTRYSVTVLIPSLSSKTVGSGSFLGTNFWVSAGSDLNARTGSLGIQSNTFDIWGVQLEPGTVANDFRRNANSLQGELAACQRYYFRPAGITSGFIAGRGNASSTTQAVIAFGLPTTMRTIPASVDFANIALFDDINVHLITSMTINTGSTNTNAVLVPLVASGLTQFRSYNIIAQGVGFVGISAEL
jgi:hypothetical protein